VHRRRNEEDIHTGDFLDMLMANMNVVDDEILSLVLDLLLGGSEMITILITMVLKFLTDCPSALQQLKVKYI
jgi:cytochrome P450